MHFPQSIHGVYGGEKKLWLTPGSDPSICSAEVEIDATRIQYRWSYEGKPHKGVVTLTEGGASFVDSWHQATAMQAAPHPSNNAILSVSYCYAGEGPTGWIWRISLCQRPTGEVVLQMINTTPWGEDCLAVEIIGQSASPGD